MVAAKVFLFSEQHFGFDEFDHACSESKLPILKIPSNKIAEILSYLANVENKPKR